MTIPNNDTKFSMQLIYSITLVIPFYYCGGMHTPHPLMSDIFSHKISSIVYFCWMMNFRLPIPPPIEQKHCYVETVNVYEGAPSQNKRPSYVIGGRILYFLSLFSYKYINLNISCNSICLVCKYVYII